IVPAVLDGGAAGVVVPGVVGVVGTVGVVTVGTLFRIDDGGGVSRVRTVRATEVRKKAIPRIVVARVSTFPCPRLVRNALEPPIPSAPPSERCRSTTATSATITIR